MGVTEHWRATQLQSSASTVFATLQSLPPRHVVEFLVQIYFQYAQTNIYFIEEKWLREKVRNIHDSPLDIGSDDAGWICSVLMVLAIGTQFAHMESGPSGSVEDLAGNGDTPSEQDVGVAFYHMACKLIPDVITIASLESVQACLLLAHYALPLDTQGLAYTYLGLAVKVAIQNGMHRKYSGKDFDARTVETRNRLWWTAYTLEKYEPISKSGARAYFLSGAFVSFMEDHRRSHHTMLMQTFLLIFQNSDCPVNLHHSLICQH